MKIDKRNIYLITSIICLCFLSYQLSFKKTLELVKVKSKLEEELNTSSFSLKHNYPSLTSLNKKLDTLLSINNFSTNQSLGNTLFEKLTKYSTNNHVKIINFSIPHSSETLKKNNIIYTYEITLRGDFKNILKTVHEIENTNLGSIISQSYIKEKNYKTGLYYLDNKLLIQTIR